MGMCGGTRLDAAPTGFGRSQTSRGRDPRLAAGGLDARVISTTASMPSIRCGALYPVVMARKVCVGRKPYILTREADNRVVGRKLLIGLQARLVTTHL